MTDPDTPTPSPAETQLVYTPDEAAHILRVRSSWLRRKAAARAVPCTFLGKHLRFSHADLQAIIAASEHTTTPTPRQRRRH